MKISKKTAMLLSFSLGTLLFATTALADLTTKSGYDQLKDALKVTAQKCSESFDSYTLNFSFVIKDNGKTLGTSDEMSKFDRKKNARESFSSTDNMNYAKHTTHTYSDPTTNIYVSDSDPTYYVTEFTQKRNEDLFANPFKENKAEDVEKIADALVGSLKDQVVVKENADGSKGLEGSISEVQIPALVNALVSFQSKQNLNNGQDELPHLTKDIFVKEIKGTSKINKDGVLESILGTAVLSGKDEQGQVHEISVEALAELTDINSTIVTKPDLTGKKVVTNIDSGNSGNVISEPQIFVGKFKSDLLIKKDGKFIKIGERFIEITQLDQQAVSGHYYEELKPGFEDYLTTHQDFNFKARFEKNQGSNANFDYTTAAGITAHGSIYIDDQRGRVEFFLENHSIGGLMPDQTFIPDVE